MVYIQDKDGKALMPTKRYGKVRKLLKNDKAVVINKTPFTIKLTYETTHYTQFITLGIDAGSKNVGLSATTEKEEIYASELKLRTDIVELLSIRKELRRKRRSKLRYRKARWQNRKKEKGWLAPSVVNKIDTHLRIVKFINTILPIKKIIIETASFDIQKIKNPEIKDINQQGEQFGFYNVREYVLCRDGYKCQNCYGNSKDKVLNIHHIESRQIGGNSPNNLVTLCKTCHYKYHSGEIELNLKRGRSFKDESFMNTMRWFLYDNLKNLYLNVIMTYGYITKNTRIENKLEKTHAIDARCISGNPNVKPIKNRYLIIQKRKHNRQIHKMKLLKKGVKRLNQSPYKVFKFRLFDKILFNNKEYIIYGRRLSGIFNIRNNEESKDISYKKIKFVECRKTFLTTFAI